MERLEGEALPEQLDCNNLVSLSFYHCDKNLSAVFTP